MNRPARGIRHISLRGGTVEHLAQVNEWFYEDAEAYPEEAFEAWHCTAIRPVAEVV